MPGTRTSPRQAAKANGSHAEKVSTPARAGSKRKADSVAGASPTTKRGKNGEKKQQKTLEETMPIEDEDINMKESEDKEDDGPTSKPEEKASTEADQDAQVETQTSADVTKDTEAKEEEDVPVDEEQTAEEVATTKDSSEETKQVEEKSSALGNTENGAVESDSTKQLPSSILEKGIIYFFTRGRVGIDDPKSISDLQRSFFVLRPLPNDAKLSDGAIQDLENNRLIAIPKKVLPKSPSDRFMVFVEKSKTTIKDLKENFFQGSEYETQTVGVRSTPPVSPVGEGVYTLVTEGRNTHLAYMLTIPSELGEVQHDMGIRSKGSFIVSLKNPTVSGPSYASLPEKPDFPEEIIEEFHGRSWMPPSHASQLDYPNAQFLLIGEGEDGFDKAVETSQDGKGKDEAVKEEIEELEHQDEIRVEHLHGDNTVFDDLNISKKDYALATTW